MIDIHADTGRSTSKRLHCRQVQPAMSVPDLAQDVRDGLLSAPRTLPPKYFYDDRGSRLFDAICDTPEYYPTRTEDELLRANAREIVASIRPDHIIEFGSGTSRKTRHILEACELSGLSPVYWPFDICESLLREAATGLVDQYAWLKVHALVGDYLAGLDDVPDPDGACLFVFLGGTIGNFSKPDAEAFLREIRKYMRQGDGLLLGADRVKDENVLHEAYNDAAGYTAEFNLNVLNVLNRELDADFDLNKFFHRACYQSKEQQIEMYLVAKEKQRITLGDLGITIDLVRGEKILTEVSRKFTPTDLKEMLQQAGLCMEQHLQPGNGYYSLVLARPEQS